MTGMNRSTPSVTDDRSLAICTKLVGGWNSNKGEPLSPKNILWPLTAVLAITRFILENNSEILVP